VFAVFARLLNIAMEVEVEVTVAAVVVVSHLAVVAMTFSTRQSFLQLI
jgi:ABC-type phosphonate transport system ATPase subunit